jgi:phospholipase/carboxylesterase
VSGDRVVQRPAGPPAQLVMLFHGVGATPADLVPLARRAARVLPAALVVSVAAVDASDLGQGRQWFSVLGISEAERPARIAAALPAFVAAVRSWQAGSGLGPAQTTLIGFSQGAIMALASTQLEAPPALRVIAIAGRYAQPPGRWHAPLRLHLMHGEQDTVVPARHSGEAAAWLAALGANVSLDSFAGLGHGIDARVMDRVAARLVDEGPVGPGPGDGGAPAAASGA